MKSKIESSTKNSTEDVPPWRNEIRQILSSKHSFLINQIPKAVDKKAEQENEYFSMHLFNF